MECLAPPRERAGPHRAEGRGATVVPSNTTARAHESMSDAELQPSEDVCALGATSVIGVIGVIGATADDWQVFERRRLRRWVVHSCT